MGSSAAEALRPVAELRPDVAFELARRLRDGAGGASPAVILISTYAEKDLVEAIAAGPAVRYVPKPELFRAVIHAALGLPDETEGAGAAVRSAPVEERQHGEDPAMIVLRLGQLQLRQDAVDVFLDRAVGDA